MRTPFFCFAIRRNGDGSPTYDLSALALRLPTFCRISRLWLFWPRNVVIRSYASDTSISYSDTSCLFKFSTELQFAHLQCTPRTVGLRFAVIFSCQYCAHLFGICGICTLKIIPLLSASATSLASCELLIPVPSWQTRLPCFHHHLASSHVTSPLVLFLRSIYSSQCLVFCCVISFIFTVCWLLSAFLCLSHTIEIKKCFWNFFCPILFLWHCLVVRHYSICQNIFCSFFFTDILVQSVFPHFSQSLEICHLPRRIRWKFVPFCDPYSGNLFLHRRIR